MGGIDVTLMIVSGALLLPFLVFWGECWPALFSKKRTTRLLSASPGEVWIVIPAHNESAPANMANGSHDLRSMIYRPKIASIPLLALRTPILFY